MVSRNDLVLKNVSLPNGTIADISIRDGLVVHTGAAQPADEMRDCTGLFVVPAAVDMHVHMRGGTVQSGKEDWGTGSRSALAGGVTVVVDQPNTIPPIITPDTVRGRVREAKQHSLCQFAINGSISPGLDIPSMWEAGVMAFGEIFYAPSSYGEAVGKDCLQAAFLETAELGALATIHAEEPQKGEDSDLRFHDILRPGNGEVDAVLAVGALKQKNSSLHFCHMSTKESVLAAKSYGSVEVTPHHLFLSLENFTPTDSKGKVNPPLRSEQVRKDLWTAWDAIDVIASDHAPHTIPEKDIPFSQAPSGIPGVETMVPLLMQAVMEKKISLVSVIEKTSFAPSRILGIPGAGYRPGSRADFAIYPKESVVISADNLHSKCGWTPFAGMRAIFPSEVIMAGTIVFSEGDYSGMPGTWFNGRGYKDPAPK